MNRPKTYHALPMTDYGPDDLIKLGQVILDPRYPWIRLAEPLPRPDKLYTRKAEKLQWAARNTATNECSGGVLATVVQMIEENVSVKKSHQEVHTWEAALLETQYFELSEDTNYLRDVEKLETVKRRLNKLISTETIYMVTGLKIAKNSGQITYEDSDTKDLSATIKATLDPEGLVQAGGEVGKKKVIEGSESGQPTAPYVFAYRLNKLAVTRVPKLDRRGFHVEGKLDEEKLKYVPGGQLYGTERRWWNSGSDDEEDDDISLEIGSVYNNKANLCEYHSADEDAKPKIS